MPRSQLKVGSDTSVILQGWAANLDDPKTPLAIDLRIDGETVAQTVADRPRPAAAPARAGGAEVERLGFALMAPLEFYDGATRLVELLDAETGETLYARDLAFKDLRIGRTGGFDQAYDAFGAITQVSDAGVRGWVAATERPDEPLVVTLHMDSVEVARGLAAQPLRYLPFARSTDRRHGFRLRLPASAFDGQPHALEVRTEPDGHPIPSPLLAEAVFPPEGKASFKGLARFEGLTVAGEIVDRRPDAYPFDLALMAGDQELDRRGDREALEPAFAFDLAARPLGLIAAPLHLLILPDGERFPIAGRDPFLAALTMSAVRDGDAVTAVVTSDLALDWRAIVTLAVDRVPGPTAALDFVDGRRSVEIRFPLPADARRLEFRLGRSDAVIAGGVLDVLAHPAVRAVRATAARDAALSPLPAGDTAVRAALAGRASGLARPYGATGVSGAWSIDVVNRRVEGWAIDVSDPLADVSVELLADGEPAGTRSATEPRRFDLDGGPQIVRAGFALPLDAFGDGRTQLAVRINGRCLLGPEMQLPYAPGVAVLAAVESVTYENFVLEATGWAIDMRRPGWPVTVELVRDGARLGDVALARSRHLPPEGTDQAGAPAPSDAFGFAVRATVGPEALDGALALSFQSGLATLPLPRPTGARTAAETAAASAAARIVRPAAPGDVIAGAVERVTPDLVAGWGCCEADPDVAVDLLLYVNGAPWAHAQPRLFRADVQKRLGSHGYHGFLFELPPNLGLLEGYEIEVRPLVGTGVITRSRSRVEPALAHALPAPPSRRAASGLQASGRSDARVSIVILNQDGAEVLDRLLESAVLHENDAGIEWIVVDHGSTDASERLCAERAASGLNLRFLQRGRNFSFSASNNFGAAQAAGDVLVFMNNDIELTQPIIDRLRAALGDPNVGIAGLRLHDALPDGVWLGAPPIQHLGVHIAPRLADSLIRPFEARATPEVGAALAATIETPAVTGALLAIARADYEAVGGFDEGYFYGYEDVDLCLKVAASGKTILCLNDLGASHRRGFTRIAGTRADPRRTANKTLFNRRWSAHLRRAMRADAFERPGFWTGHRPVVAFAVTEVGDATPAADYFTALEMAHALQAETGAHVAFLEPARWYDMAGVDVLIAMVDRYDVAKATNVGPHFTSVAWARNWFDRWCEQPCIQAYSQIWASSEKAVAVMSGRLGRPVGLMRIATAPESVAAGRPDAALSSDYCFTGSRASIPREIEFCLNPREIEGTGKLFGHGWSANERLAEIDTGPVAYKRIPDVYASTKIVLDDANIATKAYGGANSRVFDALAAGRLVLSNGVEGMAELFGDRCPTWSTAEELTAELNRWLSHPDEREALAADLKATVLAEHTYAVRAAEAKRLLAQPAGQIRFGLKIAAPGGPKQLAWGDFHFADSLAAALRGLGHLVRIDAREAWTAEIGNADDVTLTLRGLLAYEPRAHQKNIAWVISHPDDPSPRELGQYDHVYVASAPYADRLRPLLGAPVEPLLQCADPARFRVRDDLIDAPGHDVLFVGNTRGAPRDMVRWGVEAGLDLAVYGEGWERFIPERFCKGEYVPNAHLGVLYQTAAWTLCDHWDDMRRHGFLSNRIFDVLGAGGELIVDDVAGLAAVIGDRAHVAGSAAELAKVVAEAPRRSPEERRATAEWIAREHSFEARARVIAARAEALLRGEV